MASPSKQISFNLMERKPSLPPYSSCIECRRLKIRCDGVRPRCARCTRLNKQCVFDPEGPKLRTARLEHRIQTLERDIAALTTASPSTNTEDPHFLAGLRAEWREIQATGRVGVDNTVPIFMNPGTPGTTPTVARDRVAASLLRWNPTQEMPDSLKEQLVSVFLARRSHFLFHMPLPTFFRRLRLSASDPEALHPALLNAIWLASAWSLGVSSLEPILIDTGRHEFHESLAHVDRLMDALHASVILSSYFRYTGRFLEAYSTSATTVQLFHAFGGFDTPSSSTPSPFALEEGEKQNLGMSIFLCDRILEESTGLPTALPPTASSPEIDNESPVWISQLVHAPIQDCRLDLRCRAQVLLDSVKCFVKVIKFSPPPMDVSSVFHSLEASLLEFYRSLPIPTDLRGLESGDIPHLVVQVNPALISVYLAYCAAYILLYDTALSMNSAQFEGVRVPLIDERTYWDKVLPCVKWMTGLIRRVMTVKPDETGTNRLDLPVVYSALSTLRYASIATSVLVRHIRASRFGSGSGMSSSASSSRSNSVPMTVLLEPSYEPERDLELLVQLAIEVGRRYRGALEAVTNVFKEVEDGLSTL